jgi:hypothetical protein
MQICNGMQHAWCRAAQIDGEFHCTSNLHSNAADGVLHIESAHQKRKSYQPLSQQFGHHTKLLQLKYTRGGGSGFTASQFTRRYESFPPKNTNHPHQLI